MIAFEASDEISRVITMPFRIFSSHHDAVLKFPAHEKMLEACSQINSRDAKTLDRKEKYCCDFLLKNEIEVFSRIDLDAFWIFSRFRIYCRSRIRFVSMLEKFFLARAVMTVRACAARPARKFVW